MDLEGIVSFATRHLGAYLDNLIVTLREPGWYITPTYDNQAYTVSRQATRPRLSVELVTFISISVVVGVLMNAAGLRINTSPSMLTSGLLIVSFWLLYAHLFYVLCKLVRGRAGYFETISFTLQKLAALYVFSAVLTFVVLVCLALMLRTPWPWSSLGLPARVVLHFGITAILLVIYLSLGAGSLNHFGFLRATFVALVLVSFLTVIGVGAFLALPSSVDDHFAPLNSCIDCR